MPELIKTKVAASVDRLYEIQGETFTPQLSLLGRISAGCHVNSDIKAYFSPDELETVAVMIEHYRSLSAAYGRLHTETFEKTA